jgi:hypothetical protein
MYESLQKRRSLATTGRILCTNFRNLGITQTTIREFFRHSSTTGLRDLCRVNGSSGGKVKKAWVPNPFALAKPHEFFDHTTINHIAPYDTNNQPQRRLSKNVHKLHSRWNNHWGPVTYGQKHPVIGYCETSTFVPTDSDVRHCCG